jgi:anaerobic magnesium-protoporphyrin IX monomethyl ester cyclase
MANVLIIGGSPFTTLITQGTALLSAIATKHGHKFTYFDLCDYEFDMVEEHELGEKQLEYQKTVAPVELQELQKKHSDNIFADLLQNVKEFEADIVGLSTTTGEYCYGAALLSQLKEKLNVPTIVGGVHPTVAPEAVIADKFIDMINVGQGEESFVELLESFDKNGSFNDTSIKNIWFKKDGEVIRNPLRPPLQSLDDLPYPNWDIFNEYHFH